MDNSLVIVDIRPLSSDERIDWLRLIRSENVGPVTFRQLIDRYGTATAALAALPELARRGGRRRAIRICPAAEANREIAELTKAGGRMIACCEPEYPPLLAATSDAPPVLSVIGHAQLLEKRAVAVVGARNGSANGIRLAETIARDLGRAGLVVASGLARGIDAAAHRGALASGTAAVMAGGIDVIYPRENEALYRDIAEGGVLVSEQPFATKPQARHFPGRNRIVSGLGLATVIIEATLKSGSLITARLAAEQGREVMAVPGNPLDPRARGTNRLIRDGAILVECADDVLEALAGDLGGPVAEPKGPRYESALPASEEDPEALEQARTRVIELLGAAPTPLDDLLRMSAIPPALVTLVLLELELAGRLQRHPGGQVSLAFEE